MNCNYCTEPMKVSKGQIVYWHKKCRTKGRIVQHKKGKKSL